MRRQGLRCVEQSRVFGERGRWRWRFLGDESNKGILDGVTAMKILGGQGFSLSLRNERSKLEILI